ncbi:MAG: bifunctional metallophosphatase/5'-nucleotidase [Deltaproteobacteria bacterium]|nr:bifunctional metallophosphatase/5'-nucleotidase [Deltaproteobacteria bacterium]
MRMKIKAIVLSLVLASGLGCSGASSRDAFGDQNEKNARKNAVRPLGSLSDLCALTILHTGDLHSHFRPGNTHYHLGGVARIKTLVNNLRQSHKSSLLLDAGDWSEGGIYYVLGAGEASLSLLDAIGYDAVVVGNHDWFNGPAVLERVISNVRPSFPILGANFDFAQWNSDQPQSKLKEMILPYKIFGPKELEADLRVGVIGLATDDSFYSSFFSPVLIDNPFGVLRRLVNELRSEVDVLILLTHLDDEEDVKLAQRIRGIDLIVGGHSHHLLRKPVQVTFGKGANEWDSYLVKTGAHGEYVGEVCLGIDPDVSSGDRKVKLLSYKVHQVDAAIAEDPAIAETVKEYSEEIEAKYRSVSQNLFTDHLTNAAIDLVPVDRGESNIGNFIVDSIYEAVNQIHPVDAAVNTSNFLRSGFIKGPINSANVFDMLPMIYRPDTDQTWKLYRVAMEGRILKQALFYILGADQVVDLSHGYFHYDLEAREEDKLILDLQLGDLAFAPERVYTLAVSEGVVNALRHPLLRERIPELSSLDFVDTGLELWKAVRGTLEKIGSSGVTEKEARVEGRVRTRQPDAAIFPHDFKLLHENGKIGLVLGLNNLGLLPASGMLTVYHDVTPEESSDNPTREEFFSLLKQKPASLLPDAMDSYQKIAMLSFGPVAPSASILLRHELGGLPVCLLNTCHLTFVVSDVEEAASQGSEVLLTNNIADLYYNR